jgi:hypothetical protein
MGDVAVGELSRLAQAGSLQALDLLRAIGTPEAAESILPFLWSADQQRATRAACCLASLLLVPGIEDALRRRRLEGEAKRAEKLEWVWEPFHDVENSALPTVAGRLTYVLSRGADMPPPTEQWDLHPRVAVPLLCILSDTGPVIRTIRELRERTSATGKKKASPVEDRYTAEAWNTWWNAATGKKKASGVEAQQLREKVLSSLSPGNLWVWKGLPPLM